MNLLLLLWLFIIKYEGKNFKTIYVNFVVLKSEEKFKTLSYVKSEKRFKN